MNASADLPIAPADPSISPATLPSSAPDTNAVLWHHRAFCRVALPVRAASKGIWQREAAGVVLTIEAGEGAALPTGKLARLLLIFLFDAAVRTGGAVVEIGDDPVAVALRIGVETSGPRLRELQEQMVRLQASRITVAWDGRPALAVFDARGRSRAGAPGWRSSIRINTRFLAGLVDHAVGLELTVLRALADSNLALDLYAWLAATLDGDEQGEVTIVGWEDLRGRFGVASQAAVEFRSGLEAALMQVQQAWPYFASVIRDDAVEFRRAGAPPPVPVPVPVVASTPEPELVAGPGPTARPDVRDEPAPRVAPWAEPPAEPLVVAEVAAQRRPAPRYDTAPAPEAAPVVQPPAPEATPVVAPPAPSPAGDAPRRVSRQTVSLKSHLTGLPQVVWLQRSNGRDNVVIEVTPGGRYDPDSCTVIALEPVALQVVGGLYTRDFERVAAWAAANRDLIDDWWDSRLDEFDEVASRVKKVPAPAWR